MQAKKLTGSARLNSLTHAQVFLRIRLYCSLFVRFIPLPLNTAYVLLRQCRSTSNSI